MFFIDCSLLMIVCVLHLDCLLCSLNLLVRFSNFQYTKIFLRLCPEISIFSFKESQFHAKIERFISWCHDFSHPDAISADIDRLFHPCSGTVTIHRYFSLFPHSSNSFICSSYSSVGLYSFSIENRYFSCSSFGSVFSIS